MTVLGYIVLANLLSTLLSVSLAAWLGFNYLARVIDKLVPVSAGLLLATAVTHLLPEAFHSDADPHLLGWVILAGIVGLFLLEKLSLIHHTHHHEGDLHHHAHGHDRHEAGRGGMPILIGDAFHNFADGVVIAGAFLADVHLGVIATLAVMAHEIPHEIGDFMILLNAGFSRRRAFGFNLLSGLSAVVGGVVGYFVLEASQALLPYALAIAAASFIYIALSDLLPEMMRRSSLAKSLPEVGLVLLGVVIAALATGSLHGGH
ncbi:MAG TPA: ZIP family metal transporter [Burkholderiaceae bacterium]|nr:ZIP family metal transporter [Burkholderiaceae bacterium]